MYAAHWYLALLFGFATSHPDGALEIVASDDKKPLFRREGGHLHTQHVQRSRPIQRTASSSDFYPAQNKMADAEDRKVEEQVVRLPPEEVDESAREDVERAVFLQNESPKCKWRNFQIHASTLFYGEWNSPNWGNLLSEYWQARGLAALAGLAYSGGQGMSQSFLKYLPHSAPKLPEFHNEDLYNVTCNTCGKCKTCGMECKDTMFPHKFAGAWVHIRKLIQEDTHTAMRNYEAASKQPTPSADPLDKGEDVLVHLRLDFDAPYMGWPGLSVFRSRLPRNVSKIVIMHQPLVDKANLTQARKKAKGHIHNGYSTDIMKEARVLLDGYRLLLKKECFGCPVEFQTGGQYEDFALIARNKGPVFCSQSTYCLWAGLANKHGPVYMPNSPVEQIHRGQGQSFLTYTEGFLSNTQVKNFKKMSAAQVVDWVWNH